MWSASFDRGAYDPLHEWATFTQEKSDRIGYFKIRVDSTVQVYQAGWAFNGIKPVATFAGQRVEGTTFPDQSIYNSRGSATAYIYIPKAWNNNLIDFSGRAEGAEFLMECESLAVLHVMNGTFQDGMPFIEGREGTVYIRDNGTWKEGG